MESVKTSALATRFRPRCLAAYSAWSTVRMTLDRSISPRQTARPMLIVTKLGFKVIKSLLGQLDGRITVSSRQPKGAAIQLDLPLDLPS
jgi:hypothetical protein